MFAQEEGAPFNSTLGFDIWPVCLRADQGCLNLLMQAWLSVNSLIRNHTKAQLNLLSGLSSGYQETDQINLTKPDRPCVRADPYRLTDKIKYTGIIVTRLKG